MPASPPRPRPSDDDQLIMPKPEWRAWACILAGPILFIILGNLGGLIPATFACVFVSALGDRDSTWKSAFILAIGVTVCGVAAVLVPPASIAADVALGVPVIYSALTDLWYGFGVALEPHNLVFCFLGVLIGNIVGVLPGMGVLATISILLPLTFGMKPVAAILMLAGVFYGAQYGGAICSILLNLPCHPPHAVTCLDGYPMTKQGRGGVALGITVIASFVGASWGIMEMTFLAPVLVQVALKFGPSEVCSLMLLGLLAGSTLARGSPIKGVAMTVFGLLLGIVGADIETGTPRFAFGMTELDDGVEIVALALGLFGIAEFMNTVNQTASIDTKYTNVQAARHVALEGRLQAGVLADVARHLDRQPVRAHSRHRTDHRVVRVLCGREEDLARRRSASATAPSKASPARRPRPIPRCRATSSRP